MTSRNKYNRNYLSRVIFRLDFSDDLEISRFDEYRDEVKDSFPNFSEQEGIQGMFNVNIGSGNFQHEQSKFKTLIFKDGRKEKKLEISTKHFVLEYSKYKNSSELLKHIERIVLPFLALHEVENVARIGLRYLNRVDLKESNQLDWEKYLDKGLTGGLGYIKRKKLKTLARYMGQLVLKKDRGDLVFNYGMPNPEYPNEITKKEFVLDYDCYNSLGVSSEKILDYTSEFNKYIEDLFEKSISDEFRKLLMKKNGR